jgi:hypothetical protein
MDCIRDQSACPLPGNKEKYERHVPAFERRRNKKLLSIMSCLTVYLGLNFIKPS